MLSYSDIPILPQTYPEEDEGNPCIQCFLVYSLSGTHLGMGPTPSNPELQIMVQLSTGHS